jgi:hypothetical protein
MPRFDLRLPTDSNHWTHSIRMVICLLVFPRSFASRLHSQVQIGVDCLEWGFMRDGTRQESKIQGESNFISRLVNVHREMSPLNTS